MKSNTAIAATIILLVALATSLVPQFFQHHPPPRHAVKSHRIYNLILTQDQHRNTTNIVALRTSPDAKYVISGYPDETPESLLERLPWLLQPGVDTIFYDPELAGKVVVDSMRNLLAATAPDVVLVVVE